MKKLLFFIAGVFVGWKFSQGISGFVRTSGLPFGRPVGTPAFMPMTPVRPLPSGVGPYSTQDSPFKSRCNQKTGEDCFINGW